MANPTDELTYASTAQAIQSHAFAYARSSDQDHVQPQHHPVVVVGAGPVGLTLAIDLAQRGQRVLLLDNDHRLSTGSRAICFAKRTLEIWDRLGVGEPMAAKGVEWNVGKVFFHDDLLYTFNLLPEPGHERPAFINLQQYYAEAYLAAKALHTPNLEIRWMNTVQGVTQDGDRVTLTVDTPDGPYALTAFYVAACDGARSPMRNLMGLSSSGRVFRDRFLIADVRMKADFPTERWFWFDPPFHPNQSVLLHRQPDGVWRIDFQLGWDADPDEEKKPERIQPRVDAMLMQAMGKVVPYELDWASVYTFACQRMAQFCHGRVFFAGDSAHGVSPFGARGANSGVQDADNLAWKLSAVLQGDAPESLLQSYGVEREGAADENILNSTRATDFITPKSPVSKLFRDATLDLARDHAFARRLVNSGRLSTPTTLRDSPLNTPDCDAFAGLMVPGAPAADARIALGADDVWWLRQLRGGFTLVLHGASPAWVSTLPGEVHVINLLPQGSSTSSMANALHDPHGAWAQRYDAKPATAYLFRPDQHVAARWRSPSAGDVLAALARAKGHDIKVAA
jgi:3-(3-hydroxy-phenyl)propionate hydroxylase